MVVIVVIVSKSKGLGALYLFELSGERTPLLAAGLASEQEMNTFLAPTNEISALMILLSTRKQNLTY